MQWVELGLGRAVRFEVAVGPGEVLAVVDGEVHVMQSVVGGTVDVLLEPVARDHVAVVDQNGPDLHQHEENHVEVFLDWADENKDAVLEVSAERVFLVPERGRKELTDKAATGDSRPKGGRQGQPMASGLQICR